MLPREFYLQKTKKVARELLGKVIIHGDKSLIITETEAYLGPEDLASHARFGETPRSKIMWMQGGYLYVYMIYGMHYMVNIITGENGIPGAVLLRSGINKETGEKIEGPGKFAKYLEINKSYNGNDLVQSSALYIDDKEHTLESSIALPRIGVDYAGKWAKKKWRYVAKMSRVQPSH